MTWAEFSTTAGQLTVLIALTGLLYRLFRLVWANVPEAVMQFIAAILSTVTALAVSYRPEVPRYQWLILGISGGILLSQNVVKSIDWISAAATQTGAPTAGIAEKPPAWWVAAQVKGAVTPEITFKSPEHLAAQIQANEAAQTKEERKIDKEERT